MSAPSGPDRNLAYLCQGYFHQDFDLYGDTAAAILDTFSEEARATVVGARDAAAALLASGASEEELAGELDRAGIDYYPPGGGMSYRQFLELVVERLATRLEERERR